MAKKARIGVSANKIFTKKYTSFRGVDFSCDASMVDDEHSPNAENLIADKNGFPEKRIGWRTIKQLDGRINGIFSFDNSEDECTLIHSGNKLYKLRGDELTLLLEGISDRKSTAKYFKGKLCILTGEEYLLFDGEKCFRAKEAENVYAPITLISRGTMILQYGDASKDATFSEWKNNGVFENKDGTAVNYGTMPDGVEVNLISGKRRNYFEYKSGYAAFILDSKIDHNTRVTMRCISTGEELFSLLVTSDNSNGFYDGESDGDRLATELLEQMKQQTAPYHEYRVIIGNSAKNNCGYVICKPSLSKLNGYYHLDGVDNFSIEFTHEVEGYAERIEKCTIMDVFENRLFFSGNPDYPNVDWYSGVNDPLYVPDINYTEIGMDSSEIMGYLRTGEKQAILKSDGDDATVYMRSYSRLEDGRVIFPIQQGTSGLGAIAKCAIFTFLDDPVYLTRNGVYAIAMQDISSERALNIRSSRINKKLMLENDIADAVMCEWNGYLVLCVGECAYVADSRQKQYPLNATNSFEYEWYYWTNIPARVLHKRFGELYFGTADGRICKFNTDLTNERGEAAQEAYADDGEAIVAQWSTNFSDDGDFMTEKTLVKTGSGVMLKSHNRSSVKVYVRTDRESGYEIASHSEDASGETAFNSASCSVAPFNTRMKKYSAIQIICRNDKVNQGFGIAGIIRRYFYGKTKK